MALATRLLNDRVDVARRRDVLRANAHRLFDNADVQPALEAFLARVAGGS